MNYRDTLASCPYAIAFELLVTIVTVLIAVCNRDAVLNRGDFIQKVKKGF
jgi:hypothetical protein